MTVDKRRGAAKIMDGRNSDCGDLQYVVVNMYVFFTTNLLQLVRLWDKKDRMKNHLFVR